MGKRIEVVTDKRSYTVVGDGRVEWEDDEEVVSIEAVEGGK